MNNVEILKIDFDEDSNLISMYFLVNETMPINIILTSDEFIKLPIIQKLIKLKTDEFLKELDDIELEINESNKE